MTTCCWKYRWAAVLALCIFAAGGASLIYIAAGRSAMGGVDLKIGRAFDEHKVGSIDTISGWGSSWPLMTAFLHVTYSKVSPKVSSNKPFITNDSTLKPLISRASQRVLHRDLKEVAALSRYPMGKRAPGSTAAGSLHIQF